MPSPFPGMDPYLEDPVLWPNFHNAFADEIHRMLNRDLPDPYYAQLEVRAEVGIAEEPSYRGIRPDVSVRRHESDEASLVAVLEPRAEISESWELVLDSEPTELAFIEIRDSRREREVVTLVEILSPSNKRQGHDRNSFLQKRAETLASETSLIEIDLLRSGDRSWADPELSQKLVLHEPRPDYLVTVNRSWQRGPDFRLQVFPVELRGLMPVVPVPLRESEPEVPLDLQYAFQQVYDSGPYRRGAVDYTEPPNPPLPEDQTQWAAERVKAWLEQ